MVLKCPSHLKLLICLVFVISCSSTPQMEPQPDGDQQVLDQLKKGGSNLSKAHKIDFYLYFPSEENAMAASETLRKEGLSVEVRTAAIGSDWLCLGRKEMLPKHSELARLRQVFHGLAKKLNGEYDGWETEVVK